MSYLLHLLFNLVLLFSVFSTLDCYKILVLPMYYKSHIISLSLVCNELANRGHDVHILMPYNYEIKPELGLNTSAVKVQQYGSMDTRIDYIDMESMLMRKMLEYRGDLSRINEAIGKYIDAESQQLLTNNDLLMRRLNATKFDLAIVDRLFFLKFLYLIPVQLGIPWVTYTDMLPEWQNRIPVLPSINPSKFLLYSDRMSFKERFKNFLIMCFTQISFRHEPLNKLHDSYRKYSDFTSLDELMTKSLLFLTTTNQVLSYPAPSMPNLIHIGGLTTRPASGLPLPDKIENFMSGADAVILVTFGSMASRLPPDIVAKFSKAFRNLPRHRFIWRLENVDDIDMPENVLLSKWLPQNDILADSRVKLFITHSGNNGQFEAVYHAVPLIGFYIVGDQPYNAKRAEAKGYGISMNIHDFTHDDLMQNIKMILNDGSYKTKISKASEIFRSARDTPAERAAYWIEHVIRFGGDHLRSSGYDLNIAQFFSMDVIVILIIVAQVILYILFRLFLAINMWIWDLITVHVQGKSDNEEDVKEKSIQAKLNDQRNDTDQYNEIKKFN